MKTFCRLCEVNCGLEATVDEAGRLVELKPDRSHPVTQGFACHKGILAREIHHDPDRLNAPAARGPPTGTCWRLTAARCRITCG